MIKSEKILSEVQKPAVALPPGGLRTLVLANADEVKLPSIKIDPEVLKQIAEVQRQWKAIKAQAPEWLAELSETVRLISKNWATIRAQIDEVWKPMQPIFAEIARSGAECKRIEEAGWLPHYTTPFAALATCENDDEAVHRVIEAHYRDNWAEVSAAFLDHLATYDLEEESKATFQEVLEAHGHGLYRLSARSLFPEIERVARQEVHGGALVMMTSQHELRKLAEQLSPGETVPGGMYAMSLFQKFFYHLYENTKTDEQLEVVAANAVPNRHASLHGLLSYGSARSSVNALIMTDFIFQIVCALKRRAREIEAESAPGVARPFSDRTPTQPLAAGRCHPAALERSLA